MYFVYLSLTALFLFILFILTVTSYLEFLMLSDILFSCSGFGCRSLWISHTALCLLLLAVCVYSSVLLFASVLCDCVLLYAVGYCCIGLFFWSDYCLLAGSEVGY